MDLASGFTTQTLQLMRVTGRHSMHASTTVGYDGPSANVLMRQSLWIWGWRLRGRKWWPPSTPSHMHCTSTSRHSCHAPRVLSGLIFGNVLSIHQLCSAAANTKKELKLFLKYLLNQLNHLNPLFQQAFDNATAYLKCSALKHLQLKSRKTIDSLQKVFLHLPYHPANPPSKDTQKLWYNQIGTPPGKLPLNGLTNWQGYDISIDRLTIAWHCPPNLANLLSYKKLEHCTVLKVSPFLPPTWYE